MKAPASPQSRAGRPDQQDCFLFGCGWAAVQTQKQVSAKQASFSYLLPFSFEASENTLKDKTSTSKSLVER